MNRKKLHESVDMRE